MANMKHMTITEALVELKLYDKKINDAIRDAYFSNVKKKSSNKIGSMNVESFEKRAKASYDSITSMIRNRSAIKQAVVLSNAQTEIEVAGLAMTVADAIERKNAITYESELLDAMVMSLSDSERALQRNNDAVEAQADKLLSQYYGKDAAKKISRDDYDSVVGPYKAANEYELVDPLGLREKIDILRAEIEAFKSNVDTALSISNATTWIDVEM